VVGIEGLDIDRMHDLMCATRLGKCLLHSRHLVLIGVDNDVDDVDDVDGVEVGSGAAGAMCDGGRGAASVGWSRVRIMMEEGEMRGGMTTSIVDCYRSMLLLFPSTRLFYSILCLWGTRLDSTTASKQRLIQGIGLGIYSIHNKEQR
jgi:hypothetical protein